MTRAQQDTQFAGWMREHSSIAVRTARSFEFDTEGQADLLQEILVEWWRSIPNFPSSGNPRQWLYRVSLNAALTWQRREVPAAAGHRPCCAFYAVGRERRATRRFSRPRCDRRPLPRDPTAAPGRARAESFCISMDFPTKKSPARSGSPLTPSAAVSRAPAIILPNY